jgi:hypothetical protein
MRSMSCTALGICLMLMGQTGCSNNKVELDKAATVAWDKTRDGNPTVPKLGANSGAMSGKGKFGSKPAGAAATTPPK